MPVNGEERTRPRNRSNGTRRILVRDVTARLARSDKKRVTPLSSEFIDIIEWTDDSRDTLSYRFPDDDRAIKRGAQLIVRESQAAQFVYLGEFGDTFGPGKHRLTTDNIPILSRIKGWSMASSRRSRRTSTTSRHACSPATGGARRTRSCCATRI
jgi:hypothetical protein